MPVTLRIMSVYRANKRKFASELAQAHEELAQFQATLVDRFGERSADAIRLHTNPTEDMIFGRVEVPKLPKEAEVAVETLRKLSKKVVEVRRKIHSPDCYFHEPSTPIPVLETLGLSWGEVRERCSGDGRLPVSSVLWLLDAIRTARQAFPNDEQMYQWISEMHDDARLPQCWRRLLRRRRERLIGFLGVAAELEEEVTCDFLR